MICIFINTCTYSVLQIPYLRYNGVESIASVGNTANLLRLVKENVQAQIGTVDLVEKVFVITGPGQALCPIHACAAL